MVWQTVECRRPTLHGPGYQFPDHAAKTRLGFVRPAGDQLRAGGSSPAVQGWGMGRFVETATSRQSVRKIFYGSGICFRGHACTTLSWRGFGRVSDFPGLLSRRLGSFGDFLAGKDCLPCHVRATSVSSHRRAFYQVRPPAIAAKLDLSKPEGAWGEGYP